MPHSWFRVDENPDVRSFRNFELLDGLELDRILRDGAALYRESALQ